MGLPLTADDLKPLTAEQKDAVLTALYVALVADGQPRAEEQNKFEEAVKLPWGKSPDELKAVTDAVTARLATADRNGKLAFLKEVAANIPGHDLREKVILAMAGIVAADQQISAGEKSSVSAFIRAFDLTPEQVERIRRQVTGA